MSELTDSPRPAQGAEAIPYQERREGPVSAAILAAGVGTLAMGVVTTLSEASTSISDWLNWYDPVGPLSGKTIVAVIVWLLAWAALHGALRRSHYETRRALTVSLVLIVLGVIGTFPTFFQIFESG
ncbi:MAG TPA: hypothetical protein VIV12_11840 [Streptosporangiaceae bacterium]